MNRPRKTPEMIGCFRAQSARDAMAGDYGDESYWRYLDRHEQELHDIYMSQGNEQKAKEMFSQSLSEALRGNDGP